MKRIRVVQLIDDHGTDAVRTVLSASPNDPVHLYAQPSPASQRRGQGLTKRTYERTGYWDETTGLPTYRRT